MQQVVRRTLRRRLRREQLWNGNVEPPLHTIFTDPEHIVRWAWATYDRNRSRVQEMARARPGLPIVRVQNRTDAARLVDAL